MTKEMDIGRALWREFSRYNFDNKILTMLTILIVISTTIKQGLL